MPHYQVSEFDRPDRLTPAQRAEALGAARDRILHLDVDGNGNVHRREVLDALDDESGA